jgi:hypothetical protein
MCHVFAFVVLAAVWWVGEATVPAKLLMTAIYLALWVLALFWWPAFIIMGVYALAVYFFFFGSEKGRRWRP